MYRNRVTLMQNLEKRIKRDVLFICNNLKDNSSLDYEMIDVIRRIRVHKPRHKNLAIVVQTFGGDGMMSYFAVELLREYYDNISIYIIGDCYSAGTIMALQTDEIYMGRNACLGAIDGQFYYEQDNGKENWYPSLQSNVNTLLQAEKDGKITPELRKIFPKRQDLLAKYLRTENSDTDLFKESLKRHCNADKLEETWKYLLGVIGWHSVPLTFKKATGMGLDVKRMPPNIEILITELIRDAEEEFGDLLYKTPYLDYVRYLAKFSGEDAASKEEDSSDKKTDKKSKKLERKTEIIANHVRVLAFIESVDIGFAEASLYGINISSSGRKVIPLILPLQFGWIEENAELEVDPKDEERVTMAVLAKASLEAKNNGKDLYELSEEESDEFVEIVRNQLFAEALNNKKVNGVPAKLLGIQDKQKLLIKHVRKNYEVEYFIQPDDDLLDVAGYAVLEIIKVTGKKIEDLSDDEIWQYKEEIINESWEKIIEEREMSSEDRLKMTKEEINALIKEYIVKHYVEKSSLN